MRLKNEFLHRHADGLHMLEESFERFVNGLDVELDIDAAQRRAVQAQKHSGDASGKPSPGNVIRCQYHVVSIRDIP